MVAVPADLANIFPVVLTDATLLLLVDHFALTAFPFTNALSCVVFFSVKVIDVLFRLIVLDAAAALWAGIAISIHTASTSVRILLILTLILPSNLVPQQVCVTYSISFDSLKYYCKI